MMLYNRILHPGEDLVELDPVKISELIIDRVTVNEIIENKIMTFQEFLVHTRNEFIQEIR